MNWKHRDSLLILVIAALTFGAIFSENVQSNPLIVGLACVAILFLWVSLTVAHSLSEDDSPQTESPIWVPGEDYQTDTQPIYVENVI